MPKLKNPQAETNYISLREAGFDDTINGCIDTAKEECKKEPKDGIQNSNLYDIFDNQEIFEDGVEGYEPQFGTYNPDQYATAELKSLKNCYDKNGPKESEFLIFCDSKSYNKHLVRDVFCTETANKASQIQDVSVSGFNPLYTQEYNKCLANNGIISVSANKKATQTPYTPPELRDGFSTQSPQINGNINNVDPVVAGLIGSAAVVACVGACVLGKGNIPKIPEGATYIAGKARDAVSSVLEKLKPSSYTAVATKDPDNRYQGIEMV